MIEPVSPIPPFWQRVTQWTLGKEPAEPLPPEPKPADPKEREVVGICCSGGGIRSASYNLGALQVLQRPPEDGPAAGRNVLHESRYLSAVSGGAYIASSYAFVSKHSEEGTVGNDGEHEPVFAPGSPEERYLRNHSTYVAPDAVGLANLLLHLFLGIVANLGLIALVFFVVSRPLARFYVEGWSLPLFHWHLGPVQNELRDNGTSVLIRESLVSWYVGLPLLVSLVLSLAGVLFPPTSEDLDAAIRSWARRAFVFGVATFTLLIFVPYLVALFREIVGGASDLFRLVSFLSGASALAVALRSIVKQIPSGWSGKALNAVAALVGPLFLVGLFLWFVNDGIRVLVDQDPSGFLQAEHLGYWLLWLLILLAVCTFADLNSWSGAPFYRRRLASAFCLQRKVVDGQVVAAELPYTTVTRLSESQPPLWSEDGKGGGDPAPELVICAAVNVSDQALVPPGRGAASFVFTHEKLGAKLGEQLGETNTRTFEEVLGKTWIREFTLMGAVATSGAAFAPSMGKMTKARYRLLMALFNLRLGLWLPNPSPAHAARWKSWQERPGWLRVIALRPRPHYLVKEMLGFNHARDKFLYVTDGGHYDNLGLVELFRRRCTKIYCFDASGGAAGDFSTLGEAIEVARVDLGVEVTIDLGPMRPDPGLEGRSASDFAVGRFRYRDDGREGLLYFARATLTPNLPLDVEVYLRKNPQFPHDPTFDQLFDEAQFEAYRQLGRRAAINVLAGSG